MQTETPLPTIHVTNYQQYIDAPYLQQAIADYLPADAVLPETINVSIAYMQVHKKNNIYTTVLVLSILGKSYRFKHTHANPDYYAAQQGLDLNNYGSQVSKDDHMHVFNTAFYGVVLNTIGQIVKAITTAYAK